MCSVSNSPDFYELLGVTRTCSKEELQSAFRSVSKRTHPDAGGNAGLFRMVTEAYSVLSDPSQRRLYDAGLEAEDSRLQVLADREAAVAAREALVSSPAPLTPQSSDLPSVVVPEAPPARTGLRSNVSAHWNGWVRCILAAALGPMCWVALQRLGVAGLLHQQPSSEFLQEKMAWLLGPPPRLRVVLGLCCLAGWGAWRLRVYLAVRPWASSLRWAAVGVWFAGGVYLPYLPHPVALISLGVSGVVAVLWGLLWARFVRN